MAAKIVARVLLVGAYLLAGASSASRPTRAEVIGGTVWLDGVPAWRGSSVTAPLAWSSDASAVAFAGRDARGRALLVVLVPSARPATDAAKLVWSIPRSAQPARAVTW